MNLRITHFLLLFWALALGSPLAAQDRVGLKLYPELSRVYNQGSFQDATRGIAAFGGGIQIIKQLFPTTHIESGLYLANRGMSARGEDIRNGQNVVVAVGDADYRYQYVAIPLMLRFDIGQFYLAAGPEFDFLINGRFNYDTGSLIVELEDRDARKFQFVGASVVGLTFDIASRVHFFVEARMQVQLQDLYKFDGAPRLMNVGLGTGLNVSLGRQD